MENKEKTQEEVLKQVYMTAKDLKILMPTLSIVKCTKYIEDVQADMMKHNYFIPETKPKLALTKLVKKKFGF